MSKDPKKLRWGETGPNLFNEAVKKYDIETCYFQKIKNGSNFTLDNGIEINNEELTFDPIPPKKYAYCSDTQYEETILPIISNVDVLYHESTFLELDKNKAKDTMHSTAIQAATIAKKANAKKLILGHYSTRYDSIELFKKEAELIMPEVNLADDGIVFDFS